MRPNAIVSTAAAVLVASAASAQSVKVEEFTLDNGMTFLLVPREDQPNNISAGWVAKVGSVNERPGITGISHFFEHMMFKGTDAIGTRDPEIDRTHREDLEKIREQMRAIVFETQYPRWKRGEIADPWDPAHDTDELAELRAKSREIMEAHREHIVKDEFDQVYTAEGATGMNAFTSHDMTFYFITVPSNKFELWAWMESDRLTGSVFREFYSERDVVHEERRLRTESTPTGKYQEQFESMFWLASPYNWPVIGWPSDLNAYTYQQAQDYFRTYYAPNNLTGVVVGDFDPDEIKPTIERYFGRLERGPAPPPVTTLEIPQQAEMRMIAEGDFPSQVDAMYHTVPFASADHYPLTVLAEILNGRTGRLYKAMVEGREIASSAAAMIDARKYAGAFGFSAEAKGDATPEQLLEAWDEVVADLKENRVDDYELEKVRNNIIADQYRSLQNNFFLMLQLGYYEALDDWSYINEAADKLAAVTAEDIQRVANAYLNSTNRAVALYTRSASAAPEDPELAALPPQMRQVARQQAQQVQSLSDLGQLRQILAQVQAQQAQAPAEYQPLISYMIGKIEARIAELEAGENGDS